MEYTNTAQWEKKCYESHKPLPVGQYLIYGGSASWPVVKDADVYVSLQDGSTCGFVSDPWDQAQVIEVNHYIPDGKVPVDAVRFRKLVEWVCNQLQSGKKVHVGCIGGHGRTGLHYASGSIRPADKPKQPTSLFLPIYEKVSNAQVPAPATTGLVLTPIQSKRNLWRK
jgi:hypothetical protein